MLRRSSLPFVHRGEMRDLPYLDRSGRSRDRRDHQFPLHEHLRPRLCTAIRAGRGAPLKQWDLTGDQRRRELGTPCPSNQRHCEERMGRPRLSRCRLPQSRRGTSQFVGGNRDNRSASRCGFADRHPRPWREISTMISSPTSSSSARSIESAV